MNKFITYNPKLKLKAFLGIPFFLGLSILPFFVQFGFFYSNIFISVLLFILALIQFKIIRLLLSKYKYSNNQLSMKQPFKRLVIYDLVNLSDIKLLTYSKYKVYYFFF
jgi:hypothetical protein